MNKNKKSQSALEFVALVGVAMVFTVLVSYGIYSQIAKFQDEKKHEFVRDVGLKIRSEILLAASSQPKYERDFEIPINGPQQKDYCAMIRREGVGPDFRYLLIVWLKTTDNNCLNEYNGNEFGQYEMTVEIPEIGHPPPPERYELQKSPLMNKLLKCVNGYVKFEDCQ